MIFTRKLSHIITMFCLIVLLGNTSLAFAAEVPADGAVAVDPNAAPTPIPTPALPPAYYEPIQTDAIEGWPAGPAVYAESAIVMDADTGTILYAKNIDEQKYPASITKIMTTLIALEHSKPTERVTFSENAIWGIERNSSHIGIRIGEVLSMEDCLYAMMLASANEVCLAVAEHIAGDVDSFVEMMNQKAVELGCTGTYFANPNGLPDDNHYTTAADMAIISKAAFQNELFREIAKTTVYKIAWTNRAGEPRWFPNSHKMLDENTLYYYEGCAGGKTGFTDVALNTLVTYATRDERNLICVSLRTNGAQYYIDTAAMLDYGFQNFQNITVKNTKKLDYRAYLMPFSATLFDCYSTQTHDDLLRDVMVSLPVEATPDKITTQDKLGADDVIERSLLYNDYIVGKDIIHQPKGVKSVLSLSSHFTGTSVAPISPDSTSTTGLAVAKTKAFSMLDEFDALPSWKYPMVALLVLLLILVIIKIGFATRRSKRKRRKSHTG